MNIHNCISDWLVTVAAGRSIATRDTYGVAMRSFERMLDAEGIKPSHRIERLQETHVGKFIAYLNKTSPATSKVYLTAVKRFFKHLNAEGLASFNMDAVENMIESRIKRVPVRAPKFPKQSIDRVVSAISTIPLSPTKSVRLQELRDIALILTLADTGMRIHEACGLLRGNLRDDKDGGTVIIGKGNKEGRIYFKKRSRRAINQYLRERAELDGATGRLLASLPVFARHDKAVGKKILPFTPTAARAAVEKRVTQILGEQAGITPHKFRHYFVTAILAGNQGKLKLAQELARHSSIQITERYAHLSDEEIGDGYKKAMGE